jgi:hypothetical protein
MWRQKRTGKGVDDVNATLKTLGGETIKDVMEEYMGDDDNVIPQITIDTGEVLYHEHTPESNQSIFAEDAEGTHSLKILSENRKPLPSLSSVKKRKSSSIPEDADIFTVLQKNTIMKEENRKTIWEEKMMEMEFRLEVERQRREDERRADLEERRYQEMLRREERAENKRIRREEREERDRVRREEKEESDRRYMMMLFALTGKKMD